MDLKHKTKETDTDTKQTGTNDCNFVLPPVIVHNNAKLTPKAANIRALGESSQMMLPVRKIGIAKKLIYASVSIGSEDPVQVFNGYGSLDWYMTWMWRVL